MCKTEREFEEFDSSKFLSMRAGTSPQTYRVIHTYLDPGRGVLGFSA